MGLEIWCEIWDLISLGQESSVSEKKKFGICCSHWRRRTVKLADRVTLRVVVVYWQIVTSFIFSVVLYLCFLQPYDVFFYFFQVSQSEGIRAPPHGETPPFELLNFDTCTGECLLSLSAPRVSRMYVACVVMVRVHSFFVLAALTHRHNTTYKVTGCIYWQHWQTGTTQNIKWLAVSIGSTDRLAQHKI
jgi:hypothetical protein